MKQPPQFDETRFESLIQYYDQTWFDYNVAWWNQENLAVHFGFYDRQASTHAKALLNTNRILALETGIRKGEKVLDAGCGRGGSSFWLADQLQVEVTGISPVKSQIKAAIQKATELKLKGKVRFLQGDYSQTPFPDNSFDVVWALESLCHADQKINFYQEAYRILKPGGRIIIAEYIRTRRPLSLSDEALLKAWCNSWAIPDLDTRSEHIAHAKAAGFSGFEVQDFTRYSWVSLKNLHKISRRWIWIGWLLYYLRIRSKVQHNNHRGGIWQFELLQNGGWFYGVLKGRKPE